MKLSSTLTATHAIPTGDGSVLRVAATGDRNANERFCRRGLGFLSGMIASLFLCERERKEVVFCFRSVPPQATLLGPKDRHVDPIHRPRGKAPWRCRRSNRPA